MFFYLPLALTLVSRIQHAGAAPTMSLDSNTLLENAQTAQKVNAQFASLKATDSCTGDEIACISNSVAQCANGTWTVQTRCLKSQSCFALPSVKQEGVVVTCTSEKKALSLITASGATGGIDGSDGSSNNFSVVDTPSTTLIASSTSMQTSPSATADASDSDYTPLPTAVDLPGAEGPSDQGSQSARYGISATSSVLASATITPAPSSTGSIVPVKKVVTVTVTLSQGTTTLSPQTTMLSPEQAADAISSLLQQQGASVMSTSVDATATASGSASATDVAENVAATSTGVSSGGYSYGY